MLGEFEQIAQIMAPLARAAKGAFALTDDAAVFACPEGEEIVVTTDTLIAGVHFFENDPADQIGEKLLAVNLSDLAAMGAKPIHYTLNASYPSNISIDWIKNFARGLAAMQEKYKIVLIGGDTTRTPGPLTLSLSAFGSVPKSKALRRRTAQHGDLLCLSGTLGDGALGLKVAKGELSDKSGFLLQRYRSPNPRTELGQALIDIATACMDVSDGLLADIIHMGCGCDIFAEKLPLSDPTQRLLKQDSSLLKTVLCGGDDYELLFSIAEKDIKKLEEIAASTNTDISVIGRITENSDIRVLNSEGQVMNIQAKGYRHF